MAQNGGKRPGAGRPKGRQNKATEAMKATLEELARVHTTTALQTLVSVAAKGESEAARVSAATALLDRGYGRPKQLNEHTGKDGGAIQADHRVVMVDRILGALPLKPKDK